MADTLVKNATCKVCDADVREGSLFCYHCGSQVQAEPDLGQENGVKKTDGAAPESTRPPLKSAAVVRKQRRAHRQPVQVTWEQPERPPVAFFVVSIALTIGAAILLVLALYLR